MRLHVLFSDNLNFDSCSIFFCLQICNIFQCGNIHCNCFLCVPANSSSTWTYEKTKLLLETHRVKKHLFSSVKVSKKAVWQQIAVEMNKHGYQLTWNELEKKYRNLRGTYRKILDNNRSTGRGRKKWPCLQFFESEYADDPANEPPAVEVGTAPANITCNLMPLETAAQVPSNCSVATTASAPSAISPNDRKKEPRKRKADRDPPAWFQKYAAECRAAEEKQVRVMQEMQKVANHQYEQRIQLLSDLNSNIKALLDKL